MRAYARLDPPDRLLMGPGPSQIHPRVLAALGAPTVGHLDPAFIALMDEIQELLRRATDHPQGVEFLLNGSLDSVAATFQVHAFVVDAARDKMGSGVDSQRNDPRPHFATAVSS